MNFMQNNNLAHSTLPVAHQVGSIATNEHLFAKLPGNSQLPNQDVSFLLDSSHSIFSSCHESFLSKVSQVSTLNTWIIEIEATDHMITSVSLYTTSTTTISTQVNYKFLNG
jgi:hypothetical protein